MEVRELNDSDLAELHRSLAPTEARSLFLVGNSQTWGIEDRGGRLHGLWLGAFEGGALLGVVAWFRGPNSITPACEGHGGLLVPAIAERVGLPHVILGTRERVDEVLSHAPASWRPSLRKQEILFALRWADYRPVRGAAEPLVLGTDRAAEAAELFGALHREWSLPTDPARNMETARSMTEKGQLVGVVVDGELAAVSCEATSTGRWIHVGGTYTRPAHRRRGHAAACVTLVLERARAGGRASEGGALFTGHDNVQAISVYQGMGFRADAPWEMCFLER